VLYPILASVFFTSILIFLLAVATTLLKPNFYIRNKKKFWMAITAWFAPYTIFILTMTGPTDLTVYPPTAQSPY